ncbi:FtsK/SpoIIIE family DNA translocase [Desulfuribacillus alkaliarsenatis]|uniref:FtsK domain-containing protein n=1 Tax=Desulfuribacillus alkaliarsenatis TaxID=766136 RepID=A0A1E5G6D1_9FIRM|nr:DNA translocase FtsK [Desulfuribacillus alkaliarsenatis]OEF98669.1 hypothetical protein BHF68_03140 [Desulfuribacillus alkaliarsenatis]
MGAFKELNRNIKYELIGIIIIVISALALGQFGSIGNSLSFITRLFAGNWGFLIPLFTGAYAVYIIFKRKQIQYSSRFFGIILFFLVLLIYSHLNLYVQLVGRTGAEFNIIQTTYQAIIDSRNTQESIDLGGGLIGAVFLWISIYLFDVSGTRLVLIGAMLIGILLITKLTIGDVLYKAIAQIKDLYKRLLEYIGNILGILNPKNVAKIEQAEKSDLAEADTKETNSNKASHVLQEETRVLKQANNKFINQSEDKKNNDKVISYTSFNEVEKDISATAVEKSDSLTDLQSVLAQDDKHSSYQDINRQGSYRFPSIELLENRSSKRKVDINISSNIRKLEATLESFGVVAKVVNYSQGPSVTRYELQPAIGVKVSKVLNLTDDLALALAAKDIRMEAPIPGKAAIGIEVPNQDIEVIGLREVVSSNEFKQASSKLTIALGKDLSGNSIVADLAKMPHLLIAGSTGSGKSVCVNGIITSILYKATPDEVKLFMIDPKMVELNVYNGIPHLVTPVVTDPRQASYLLKKVVQEMERRYRLFAERKARDLERYNFLIKEEHSKGNDSFECLPQIVVIIDELADLMMVAPGDVEDAICRIAQMARAAGIHLIIATQRPSVDVITGIIKANIPSRIAFSVASQTDSRTILDMGGAEKLLGRGDMLFLPVGAAKPVRLQGAYLSEQEIEEIVTHVKSQQQANSQEELLDFTEAPINDLIEDVQDELYLQAVDLVVDAGQASVSYLQRKLKIGYARAARLIDTMEEQGVVGSFEGSKPREVLITKEQHIQQQQNSK